MKLNRLKILKGLCLFLPIFVIAVLIWLRTGDEEALDYSSMAVALGPQDAEVNGYTYLHEFSGSNEVSIPETYPYDFEGDIDYDRFENWDLERFRLIVRDNWNFIQGVEVAFDREEFLVDQEMTFDTIVPAVGLMRHYLRLRLLEARTFLLTGQSGRALERMQDLTNELERLTRSGGGIIGLLSSIALNEIISDEISVYQARGQFASDQLIALAHDYNLASEYTQANQLVIRQEFHAAKDALDRLARGAPIELGMQFSQSVVRRFFHRMLIFIGLRKTRTMNEIFLAYSEYIENAPRPVQLREYPINEAMEIKSYSGGWQALLSRNPYGTILLPELLLFPMMQEKVEFALLQARTTALSLALQAYYQNEGRLPDNLDLLLPDYLPEIPLDPYDHAPMRYSRAKGILYSVGNDFVDNGGSALPFRYEMGEGEEHREAAEYDKTEPTFPLMFLPKHRTVAE